MNRIVRILMERDEMTREEAEELVEETREEVLAAADSCEVDDIMADYLGLEPDYIIDLLC